MWVIKKFRKMLQVFHDWNHGNSQSSLRNQFSDIFELDPKAFIVRDKQKDCVVEINSLYPNIHLYLVALRTASDSIGTETKFHLPFETNPAVITVSKLFMNGANQYLDAPTVLKDIKQLTISLVRKIEQEQQDTGVRGFNKLMSYKLALSVNALAQQLRKYSS